MKHLPIDSASAVPGLLDNQSHSWILERDANGKLEERLDPGFLGALEESEKLGTNIAEALVDAAAQLHVAQTRLW